MAKASPAKTKMLASRAKKEAAAKRAAKQAQNQVESQVQSQFEIRIQSQLQNQKCDITEADKAQYAEVDGNWREIGLAAPARRALVNEGFYQLSDLRKVSLAAIKDLHGMGPNAIRILVAEMKKQDLSFRS